MNEKLNDPIPVKFYGTDQDWLDLLTARVGIARSDVVRRAVRVLVAETQLRPEWNWIQDTGQPLPPLTKQQQLELQQLLAKEGVDTRFADIAGRAKAAADQDPRRRRLKVRS